MEWQRGAEQHPTRYACVVTVEEARPTTDRADELLDLVSEIDDRLALHHGERLESEDRLD